MLRSTLPPRHHRLPDSPGHGARIGVGLLLAIFTLSLQGCNIIGFFGGMAETNRRNSTKRVHAEYTGLKAKNWAVVIIADRSIQAEFPGLVTWMEGKFCERLVNEQTKIAAAGMVPADKVLRYTFDHPSWVSMPYSELAKALQVNRLIVVEVLEYRLNEPGNQYLWSGVASGTVGVVEADTMVQDEFAFSKPVRVRFPDDDNSGPADLSRAVVTTALGNRFLDRATWLFYDHDEPYYPKY